MHIHCFTVLEFALCILTIAAPALAVGFLLGRLRRRGNRPRMSRTFGPRVL